VNVRQITREGTDFKTLARDFLAKRIEAGEPNNAATKAAAGVDAANALGRMSPADRATVAETKAAPVALEKAKGAVADLLMNRTPERTRYQALVKEDNAKGTDTAAAYRDTLIAREMKPPTGAPAAAPSTTPIKIANKAEFDKLPSGTSFIAPDGSIRTKP
jgi:hypothetical protein